MAEQATFVVQTATEHYELRQAPLFNAASYADRTRRSNVGSIRFIAMS